MYKDRLDLYRSLEAERNSKLLVYVTGDRPGLETQIADDAIDIMVDHLESMDPTKRISLFLYTRGGKTLAAWNMVNLIKQFCDYFEVIIPSKAHSAGTLISLGANKIIMTKQATLSPIDPSVNSPLNPSPSGSNTLPVSVEAVKGFLELAKVELNVTDQMALSNVLIKLADIVHPLVLGEVYRARTQIQMLAEKLLKSQVEDQDQMKRIVAFLCSDSGSHDYTINRAEARDYLGMSVETPSPQLYTNIKSVFGGIKSELALNVPYNPAKLAHTLNTQPETLEHRRCLIQSINGGSDVFVTRHLCEKRSHKLPNGGTEQQVNVKILSEGWEHEQD